MYQKRFIKINCIITLIAFVVSIFSVNFAFTGTANAQENVLNNITDGVWKIKSLKGEFDAAGTGGYEKWADGKQRFVLRDSLGHLMSWGEAKIDKLTGGQVKVTVKDSEGTFEAVKVSVPALEKAAAVKSAIMESAPQEAVVKSAPVALDAPVEAVQAPAAVETAPKMTIGQKLSALKTKITTPIENGGKGSASWEKGYNFGKDTPSNLVNKVKGVFTKGDSTSSSSTASSVPSAPASSPASASPVTASGPNAPAPSAGQASTVNAQVQPSQAPAAVEAAPKMTIGEKLSALKTKVTTPIETGGKGSAAWEKGYNFGKDAPANAVNTVKGVFTKGDSAASSPAAAS
ncbi:MAG TPA: hypothetical protein PKL57_18905, partial [Candidatus Wallbacteria bacterium]|nr:hypothetical protein [Candidatus Wallbacteria bacterium]